MIFVACCFATGGCSSDVEHYNWNRKICHMNFDPLKDILGDVVLTNTDSPNQANIHFSEQESPLKDKKILFVGDSHMRGLASMFLYHTCGFKESVSASESTRKVGEKDIDYFEKFLDKKDHWKFAKENPKCQEYPDDEICNLFSKGCYNTQVSYLGEHSCAIDAVRYFPEYDHVIMNCGHHPAASMHYTYDHFEDTVKSFFEGVLKIQQNQREKTTHFYWLENCAQPIRADHFVHDYKDWRTSHRLILFDSIVKDLIAGIDLQMTIVPAFQSTLALFDKMCDCAHYPVVARMPQLLNLLDLMSSKA